MIGSGSCVSNARHSRVPGSLRGQANALENCRPTVHLGESYQWVRSLLSKRLLFLLVVGAGTCGLTGCAKVLVPDVSQQELSQAEQTLTTAKLKPGSISGASGAGAYVVSQSPAAGQQVAANSTVNLVVEEPVTIPTLTGINITDAVSTLQGLGLKVAFVSKPTVNPFAKTKVELQNPLPTSSVHHNAIVTLTVTTPPDIGALLGLVAKEPAYQNLNPQYKNVLDAFLGNPSTPTGMAGSSSGSASTTPTTPTK